MPEEIRAVRVTVEVDTNERTIQKEFSSWADALAYLIQNDVQMILDGQDEIS
jgi:hypothetical protein